MTNNPAGGRSAALAACGVVAPIVYTAAALAASINHPDYDHLKNFVSELGAAGAPGAAIMEIARANPGARRFVTAYYVNDRTAADLLMDWFQRQKGVASVRLEEGATRTHARGAGNREAGAVYLAEDIWWELVVESPPKELGPSDVVEWVRLLQGVPADTRWRLGPSIVGQL